MTDTDDVDALEGVDPEHVLFLTRWAAKHGAVVDFAGQCGFGRECVGVKVGGTYLDYGHLWDLFGRDQARWESWWTPQDSYHKHPCMAVLGRGPSAVAQLHAWASWLDEHGWTVLEEYREPASALDAAFHGMSTPKLMPPTEQAEASDAVPVSGLDKVRDAVRRARGGDAPTQIQGFA